MSEYKKTIERPTEIKLKMGWPVSIEEVIGVGKLDQYGDARTVAVVRLSDSWQASVRYIGHYPTTQKLIVADQEPIAAKWLTHALSWANVVGHPGRGNEWVESWVEQLPHGQISTINTKNLTWQGESVKPMVGHHKGRIYKGQISLQKCNSCENFSVPLKEFLDENRLGYQEMARGDYWKTVSGKY